MLFSCGHVLQKMTSQGKSGWPILWMWRNLLPQATLSFLNKIMNAIDYSISQQQKPTMSLQKGTIISRLAQLFGGSLIKLDHPHHRGSNVFFSYFNFFAFEFSLQNAMLLSKLSSTLNIMISHTFFSLLLWNTHTSQTKKNLFMVLALFSTIWETGGLTEWLTGPWQLRYSTSWVTVFCKDGIRFSRNLHILQI